MTQDEKEQIREIVNHHVNDSLFSDLCDRFNLKTGDIEPLEHMAVKRHVEELSLIAINFVEGNQPYAETE